MNDKLLTITEASERLKVSEATCRNWIKAKTLEINRLGNQTFILESSINRLIENNINGKLSSRRNKTKKQATFFL